MAVKPINRERLVKLLGMTASSNDGEALNAVRMANAMIKEAGKTWEYVIAGITAMAPSAMVDPFRPTAGFHTSASRTRNSSTLRERPWEDDQAEIEKMFEYLFQRTSLKSGFRAFLDSVYNYYQRTGYLTRSQREEITKAYKNSNRGT